MTKLPSTYYSHGKLLLTGEYLVMFGAESLAVPVNFGQEMIVEEGVSGQLTWTAYIQHNEWFTAELQLPQLEVKNSSDPQKAGYLVKVLKEAQKVNPLFLSDDMGVNVTTRLNYPQQWGLGSSSTFISNIAKWANVDAMELNKQVSEGSGYDIACTLANGPILYQVHNKTGKWEEVNFSPSFRDHLYFIFLGKKQDTANSIVHFKRNYQFSPKDVTYMSQLTTQLLRAKNLKSAISVIDRHESFLSALLGTETVKQSLFNDFRGSIKSLGAWGGDFALIATEMNFEEVKKYFDHKGFETVLRFEEMVLNPKLSTFDLTPESNGQFAYSGQNGKTVD